MNAWASQTVQQTISPAHEADHVARAYVGDGVMLTALVLGAVVMWRVFIRKWFKP